MSFGKKSLEEKNNLKALHLLADMINSNKEDDKKTVFIIIESKGHARDFEINSNTNTDIVKNLIREKCKENLNKE